MCKLPLTAILVASDVMAASKQPRRSLLTLESNFMTSLTYDVITFKHLNTSVSQNKRGGEMAPPDQRCAIEQ